MSILITGGSGYTGSVLTNQLIKKGMEVTVVDNQWFGNYLIPNKNLKILKKDVRNIDSIPLKKVETIVHLANIANDPSVELDTGLSWEVNVLATKKLIDKAIKNRVKNFIFASSGSVYGVKNEKKVTEELSLVPISTYNKTKMIAERVIQSYKDLINIYIIRPATVCGFSPRMRLDVVVNMFVFQALKYKTINIFGGKQLRPHINIKDLANVYEYFILNSNLPSGIYNAGFENFSLIELAKKVTKFIPATIKIDVTSSDVRSYRQNSEKLLATGFEPKYFLDEAILDLQKKFKKKKLIHSERWYNVSFMRKMDYK
jgi:nucleoside-diphosphate-sugar epimerase